MSRTSEKGLSIVYENFAPEAKENFYAQSNDGVGFSNLSNFSQHNFHPINYGNPCELYQTVLDGSFAILPDDESKTDIAFWSQQISDENGLFETPLSVSFESSALFSSQGISIVFDEQNGVFANHILVSWYRKGELLSELEYYPTSANQKIENSVQLFDKIQILFYGINMPNNRLRLSSLEYGFGDVFSSDELSSAKVIQQVNPISSEVFINTCDFVLQSPKSRDFSFQRKQALKVKFNGEMLQKVFVKDFRRVSATKWNISCEDYIGLLEDIPFEGGIYNQTRVGDLFAEISAKSRIPFDLERDLAEKTVSGYIPYSNCRNAVAQICFAIQAVADTSGSESVKIQNLSDTTKQHVPLSRIFEGQNFKKRSSVTGVELVSHKYTKSQNEISISVKETNHNTVVRFNQPLHSVVVKNGDSVEIGSNYAIVNPRDNCVIVGKTYEHDTFSKRKNIELVAYGEIENVALIDNATLVSSYNIDNVLDKCYNWLVIQDETNLKIVENRTKKTSGAKYGEVKYGSAKYGSVYMETKTIYVGDVISFETEYLGDKKARVVKQSFNLNGGILVKDCTAV